ncbi:general amidase-like protein [Lineolata rhizophorae]|uniref:General amidase-like protein n=1 Tax=Lineolata rhizophorae TaxID=578093 RepID=A0A6A6PD69_9PEZI|nr:general amidase-like protein [Lineolata rhizophorae]
MTETWQSIAQRKKTQQTSRIPPEWRLRQGITSSAGKANVLDVPRSCGILSSKELEITEKYDATALAAEIASRRLTSVEVTIAFCKRAAIAHQLTNCLTEIFFDQAVPRAAALDAHLASGAPPLSPLHGVPISLKDCFKVPCVDTSIGLAALCFKRSQYGSTLVSLLLSAGAVLYCKTNIPQTMLALDSHNNVFGRSLHPSHPELTIGGSTGGEAALLALRGSVLGVGTDIGGSIRIPAFCGGLYGIKPSAGRIPLGNIEGGTPPANHRVQLSFSAGPLARTQRDCELFLQTVAGQKPWEMDADVHCGDWQSQGEDISGKKLVVGVARTDGITTPLPPVQNVMNDTVAALKRQGIDVVELDLAPLLSRCQSLANKMMSLEGGNMMKDLLDAFNEPLSPWLVGRFARRQPRTLAETLDFHRQRMELENLLLRVWKGELGQTEGKRLDAIICPIAPHPVPPIDRWNAVGYTSDWVLLNCPAGSLPVRPVTSEDLKCEITSPAAENSWDKVNRELWTSVDRGMYLDSPLSVQVVGPKLQERRLCQALATVDDALKKEGFGSDVVRRAMESHEPKLNVRSGRL